MDTLRDDGARKVLAGLTTVEEVLAATQEDVEVEPASPAPVAVESGGSGVSHGGLRVPRHRRRDRQAGARRPRRGQRARSLRAALKREGVLLTNAHEERRRAGEGASATSSVLVLPPRQRRATSR